MKEVIMEFQVKTEIIKGISDTWQPFLNYGSNMGNYVTIS